MAASHQRHPKSKRLCRTLFLSVCLIFGLTGVFLYRQSAVLDGPSHNYLTDHRTFAVGSRRLLSTKPNGTDALSNFPPDVFTQKQRLHGGVILHIAGMVYMFVALAIVCDEFFIPALEVITEKMGISEDVAGATFMAAGGSAPELFTSIIGVFISKDDVGIGTIVGSAVFNILFVIAMCAIFSKTVLELTWWPLFRDVSFYSATLITLMLCFRDSVIHWWEALILLLWYAAYVTFMKFNSTVEAFVKKFVNRAKVDEVETRSENGLGADKAKSRRKASVPLLHGGSSKFRQGVLQLMIHSIDPLHQEVINAGNRLQSSTLNGISNNVHPPGTILYNEEADKRDTTYLGQPGTMEPNGISRRGSSQHHHHVTMRRASTPQLLHVNSLIHESNTGNLPQTVREPSVDSDEVDSPLDVSWPNQWHKRFTYVILAPIIIPLWLTLPDVRRPEKRKWFAFSFIGSIIWIALFSYLMVWWATIVGFTFSIPNEIMGLTFLAAGTSIPDLITSVLVARKGLGDMAVSSSVGSNIFDVTVGLPFPWLLYGIIEGDVEVNSTGMACSILMLFLMLLFVILSIAIFKWKLNLPMAITMFILYFVFIILSLLLEYKVIDCSSFSI